MVYWKDKPATVWRIHWRRRRLGLDSLTSESETRILNSGRRKGERIGAVDVKVAES